ncbi:DUF3071 domain-containing protein [Mycobacterium sp. MYCO198283]|uniref:septation protein SepH n=1 Tax=Mycobacterium sp. MYCO198283 TaxID=2883505 RepID=UPI001E4A2C61|nr:septation protein SepH [Mycobacterium sp. MYCO198283]MCG5431140.1 DUF3071 domain-containing protein [Mycobacterium sp. MYCO198283]
MRELRVVGLDTDGRHVICAADGPGETFLLRVDEKLRAAVRGEIRPAPQPDSEVNDVLRPKEIQARIRAGASVEQIAAAAGMDPARVERFAHPVLLERSRAAELAAAAHPVLADGPSVMTLLETVTTALIARGLNPTETEWDAWKNEDGRWTVQLQWQAGRSQNTAHFRFTPGAHGGTVAAVDDPAHELIDPHFTRQPLRPVAPLAQLEFADTEPDVATPEPAAQDEAPAERPSRRKRAKPAVPAWEDVLLGVRSSGQP